ncbi:hypothetical protein ACTHSO_11980, partial [Neisseria sp. P0009.S004]
RLPGKRARLNEFTKFQLSAARRRRAGGGLVVKVEECFNTQPPEGGWSQNIPDAERRQIFNTKPN